MSCSDPAVAARAREYVLENLSEPDRDRFENHLAGCRGCAGEVLRLEQSLVRLGNDARSEPSVAWSRWGASPALPAAVAAAAVLLILGYPAFLGISRLPKLERELRALSERQNQALAALESQLEATRQDSQARIAELARAASGGIVQAHYLSRPLRGGAPVETIRIAPDEAVVLIGVEMEPPDALQETGTFRFEVTSADRTVWSGGLTGEEVKRHLDSPQGAILLRIPAADLPEGDYVLKVDRMMTSRTETVLLKRFRVSR